MKKIRLLILSLGLVFSFGLATVSTISVSATADPIKQICDGSNNQPDVCKHQKTVGELVGTIVDVLLFGIGALSVVMIIVSGIRYSVSMGDAGNITKAKNSLLYSVIGLAVALLAYPVVHWLIGVLLKK